MWYNTKKECYIENDYQLRNIFYELANDNLEYFDIDDLIEDMYPPFYMFGVTFYPCEIIKTMDKMLYDQIREDIMSDWVEDAIYRLNRLECEEGDTVASLLDETEFTGLKSIVWKEEGENE